MRSRLLFGFFAVCAMAAPLHAQDSGVRLSGLISGVFGEGETNIETGAAVGYRLTPHVGFSFEALALPDLELSGGGRSGRGVVFLSNFVTEMPTPARWLIPYVEVGGGFANLTQTISRPSPAIRRADLPRDGRGREIGGIGLTLVPGFPVTGRRSETALALSVGGGVDFQLWRGLAVGPNLGYRKLFGVQDRDFTRIGLRATYRF